DRPAQLAAIQHIAALASNTVASTSAPFLMKRIRPSECERAPKLMCSCTADHLRLNNRHYRRPKVCRQSHVNSLTDGASNGALSPRNSTKGLTCARICPSPM